MPKAHHLGIPTYNSPGFAPRRGTEDHAKAEAWTKKYHQWLSSTIGKGDKK